MNVSYKREQTFKCGTCGSCYRSGDVVTKKCCISHMEQDPELEWARNPNVLVSEK